jgi:Icc protein
MIRELDPAGDVLRLVQITDTHLREETGGTLLGLDTDFSLQHVIELAQRERSGIDLVLGTGDISDHGSRRAYSRAAAYFARLCDHVGWLVGNHDDHAGMADVLGSNGVLTRVFRAGNWQVVLLNSQVPGEVGGELGAEELGWLERCLDEGANRGWHSLVCLHHQPVPMGSQWIDEQQIVDSDAFFGLIDRYREVRGVLWGHVHQALDSQRNDVALMSSPSSCIQFAANAENFTVADQAPGYRWLDLHPDGRIETGISRVEDVEFNVDLQASGYLK